VSRRGWVLFSAMCLIWGIPYLLIKVAVEEVHPATLVLARTAVAAALLLPVAAARGLLRPLLPRWRWVLVFAGVEVCVPWLLLGYAEQRLSSSLTGLLIAAVPLVGALLALGVGGDDRLDARRVTGLLVGLGGVALLVGLDVGSGDLGAVAAVAVVVVCYATGPLVLARRLSDLPGLGVVAASLGAAALAYVPAGLAQAPRSWPAADTLVAVTLLALVCTGLAFLVFFALIGEVGPVRATVFTYVNPAVAVLLGVVLLGEAFSGVTALGFVLVLGGSVLATLRTRPAPAEASVTPHEGRAGALDEDAACLAQPVAEP
jgi:drug/metabolite transporter (DMT)-like permease